MIDPARSVQTHIMLEKTLSRLVLSFHSKILALALDAAVAKMMEQWIENLRVCGSFCD